MVTRRSFLRAAASAAGGALIHTVLPPHAHAQQSTRVVSVTDGAAWPGDGWADTDLDPTAVRNMVERALTELTQTDNTTAALQALIPDVSNPTQRYGIKVNCVNEHLPSHPRVVAALCELLIDAGALPSNIIVFDRSAAELVRCGFETNDLFYAVGADEVGYDDSFIQLTDASIRLSKIVSEEIDHLINIPVLKNHQMAGVTLALKNHFGSIDRPDTLHAPKGHCSPSISEVNALEAIRTRTRLILVDGLFATYESGLGGRPDFAPMTLLAATDPVASDVVGKQLIDHAREQAGLPATEARHIDDALERGLGSSNVELAEISGDPVPQKPKPWELDENGCSCSSPSGAIATAAAVLALAWRRK